MADNLERPWRLRTSETSAEEHIIANSKDTKKICKKQIGGKGFGGYACTYNGWLF